MQSPFDEFRVQSQARLRKQLESRRKALREAVPPTGSWVVYRSKDGDVKTVPLFTALRLFSFGVFWTVLPWTVSGLVIVGLCLVLHRMFGG